MATMPPAFQPALTALEDRAVPAANLQVIHNSPFPTAAGVDVYVNNTLPPELTNLRFREATPYLVQDSGTPLFVSIRPAGASIATPPLFNRVYTLADNSTNILIAQGDPGATGTGGFNLLAVPDARLSSGTAGKAELRFVHGSTDAAAVDIKARGVGTLVNDLAPGTVAPGYASVTPGNLTLDVTAADGVTRVGSYAANLAGAGTTARTVLASGFAGPLPDGADAANRFGLLSVDAGGTATLLAAAPENPLLTSFAVGANGSSATAYDFRGQSLLAAAAVVTGNEQERAVFADVTGDGQPDLVTGSGPGTASRVTLTTFSTTTGQGTVFFSPFEASFTGGVFVAAGDIDGDGKADVVVTPDQGGGPVVAIYSGAKLAAGMTGDDAQITRFFGIDDPAFRGGARAAVGDVNADGTADLAVAAGFGGGPRLALFNGKSVLSPVAEGKLPPKLAPDFFVFEQTLRNGVFVTVGDVSGDGFGDIVVGGGPGGGPRVLAVSGRDLVAATSRQTPVGNFFAGDTANRDGVRVAAKDLDGDPFADLVVGLGSPGTPQVRGFAGKDFAASITPGTVPTALPALELNPFGNVSAVYVG